MYAYIKAYLAYVLKKITLVVFWRTHHKTKMEGVRVNGIKFMSVDISKWKFS